jgi:hypothetical protein
VNTDKTTPLRTKIEPFTEDDAHAVMNAIAQRFVQTRGEKPHPYCKGGDLMYLGVAMKFGCPLVTVDQDLLLYGSVGLHRILHPKDWT